MPQVVGKLFSTTLGYAEGMVQSLGKIWCPGKGIGCKELGDNLSCSHFFRLEAKGGKSRKGPWSLVGNY